VCRLTWPDSADYGAQLARRKLAPLARASWRYSQGVESGTFWVRLRRLDLVDSRPLGNVSRVDFDETRAKGVAARRIHYDAFPNASRCPPIAHSSFLSVRKSFSQFGPSTSASSVRLASIHSFSLRSDPEIPSLSRECSRTSQSLVQLRAFERTRAALGNPPVGLPARTRWRRGDRPCLDHVA
jgi:hypothetical protein